jgi:cytochrome b561
MKAGGPSAPVDEFRLRLRWSASTIVLHWLSAIVIMILLGLGWFMVHGDIGAATKFDLFQFHKSLGFLSLVILSLRLAARFAQPAPRKPPTMPHWEQRLAGLTHAALYLLLLTQVMSGWLLASAATIVIPMRFFGLFVIPAVVRPNGVLEVDMAILHYVVSRLLLGLVVVHVAAALKHHFIDRDEVLKRMFRFR